MRIYETGTIFNPDLSDDQVNELIARIEGEIEKHGGKIIEIDQWGVRKLAYRIERQARGYYTFIKYGAPSSAINPLEYSLRVYEEVLRFMTVKLEEDVEEKELATMEKVHKKPEVVEEEPEEVPPAREKSEAGAEGEEGKAEDSGSVEEEEKPESGPEATEDKSAEEESEDKPDEAAEDGEEEKKEEGE